MLQVAALEVKGESCTANLITRSRVAKIVSLFFAQLTSAVPKLGRQFFDSKPELRTTWRRTVWFFWSASFVLNCSSRLICCLWGTYTADLFRRRRWWVYRSASHRASAALRESRWTVAIWTCFNLILRFWNAEGSGLFEASTNCGASRLFGLNYVSSAELELAES